MSSEPSSECAATVFREREKRVVNAEKGELVKPHGWASGVLSGIVIILGTHGALAGGSWITHPAAISSDQSHAPIALQFRHEVWLKNVPLHCFVHVSADNRYVLYANGRRVAAGPSRGDLDHWRYQRLDLATYFHKGLNVVAAEVWSDGKFAARAQVSARTAFLMSAEDVRQDDVNSSASWLVRIDRSRTVGSGMAQLVAEVGPMYYVAGPPETHDGSARAWDWAAARSSAKDWAPAVSAVQPSEVPPWELVQDVLPQMSYIRARGGRVVSSEGIPETRFPTGPVTISPNSQAVILLDAGQVQSAYPRLILSGGRGATVTITYTEALYGPDKKHLSDRAQVAGGKALGLTDTFMPGGGLHEVYQPYWWRTWRFAEIRIKTSDRPLQLARFERYLTGYPFQTRARFVSSDPELNRIWKIGWNTVRLDAHETFMDTAYWEQIQYAGDTRIMALVADAVSGDPRLYVQAIKAFDASRKFNGFPQAGWPSRDNQFIPPFALLWVGMTHDFWMRRPDPSTVQQVLPGIRAVLDWYANYVGPDGLVGGTPSWRFIDWRPGLSDDPMKGFSFEDKNSGNDKAVAPGANSCIITMFYIGALKQAANLEQAVGDQRRAASNRAQAERLADAVRSQCWSAERQLYANTPDKKTFSQHANSLAVLYDIAPKSEQIGILDRITVRNGGIKPPSDLIGVTYYFSYYLARALEHAGLSDRYIALLTTWREMLTHNFTTWPENPDPSRSDSHAWSAHPTLDLLSLVAGIQPSAPGFASVRIAPHLGSLTSLDAALVHPKGLISVKYQVHGRTLNARIRLPSRIRGEFEWSGQNAPLRPGLNTIKMSRKTDSEP